MLVYLASAIIPWSKDHSFSHCQWGTQRRVVWLYLRSHLRAWAWATVYSSGPCVLTPCMVATAPQLCKTEKDVLDPWPWVLRMLMRRKMLRSPSSRPQCNYQNHFRYGVLKTFVINQEACNICTWRNVSLRVLAQGISPTLVIPEVNIFFVFILFVCLCVWGTHISHHGIHVEVRVRSQFSFIIM